MPTLVLLDVSLSMSRIVSSCENDTRLIDLARSNLLYFFDQLSIRCKLEHTALIIFSSLYETLVEFTREYEILKEACDNLVTYDKTNIELSLKGVEDCVCEKWGNFVPVNLILITDSEYGIGKDSLMQQINRKFPPPFSFPCYMSIFCLCDSQQMGSRKMYYEQLIAMNYGKGELIIPDVLNDSNLRQCFDIFLSQRYNTFDGVLKCGHFESKITLSPPPSIQNTFSQISNLYKHPDDRLQLSSLKLNSTINIIGFLDIQSFSNPAYMSRHLVIPCNNQTNGESKDNQSFQPSFCVLLHGSLKMEKMGAIVKLSNDWFGMLYSWADNKKKSNLMLTIFEPGLEAVPWLGNLRKLGPANELPINSYQQGGTEDSPFPVVSSTRRSYHSQVNTVWIKASGLQSDAQKMLRYAKKLPEKQSAFFKEVNKLRRAGVAYGFHDLLFSLATTLEHEAENMKAEVKVQLRHVAEGFRNAPTREMNKNIVAINVFRKKSEHYYVIFNRLYSYIHFLKHFFGNLKK